MSFANLSATDRAVRIVLGVLMLAAGWSGWFPEVWALALKIFAWVPLLTAAIGWCPLYALLGIRTARPSPPGRARR